MSRRDLIKKIEALFEQFEREHTWGTVEVHFNNGVPVVLKKTETERLEGETRNDKRQI